MSGRGFMLAAPASRSGKTTLTLAIAAALKEEGREVALAKTGPDYIDPGFHTALLGRPSYNLDGWAMDAGRIGSLAKAKDLLIVEGAMGLFDGAAQGQGASAAIAKALGLPVILVVDCSTMSQSVGALVRGFMSHDPELHMAGVILNRVGSARHERLLREALAPLEVPVLGCVRRAAGLALPSRHLGLVQAREHEDLGGYFKALGARAAKEIDLEALCALAAPLPNGGTARRMTPLGQHVAIAKDAAFSFIYPHLEADWRAQGAKLSYFSPLADAPPHPDADAIYLPGGYPELHASRLTRAGVFRQAMRAAAASGKIIYGECGGYMVLGHAITDKRDIPFPMLGLLDLETSFAARKMTLGYVDLAPLAKPFSAPLKGHIFHYAATMRAEGQPLFEARWATQGTSTKIGLVSGSVSGSFAHIIDHA